jgi:hypothetical protein
VANFSSYTVQVRGTGSGIEDGVRAVVTLFDGTTVVGSVRYWDAGFKIPSDTSVSPVTMNVPIAMLPAITDILRHEGPLQIDFNSTLGRLLLHTATLEPVGEDET